jgi:SulP family sulfate permease
MTMYGMDAAMIAGFIAAISTFVVQNMTYVDPVRGFMSATTLRSSQWNRSNTERAILDDPSVGRGRILVIQLQGHLFFGNMAHLSESINRLLTEKRDMGDEPWIVILDFSLVLGIDSSAAQAMAKLKNSLRKRFNVELSIFVSGSDRGGFPCAFDLSRELSAPSIPTSSSVCIDAPDETTGLLERTSSRNEMSTLAYSGSHVCDTLDLALVFSENALIHKQDLSLLEPSMGVSDDVLRESSSLSEEREVALRHLENLCPGKAGKHDVELLFSKFVREVFAKDEFLWRQGSPGDCVKLLLRGTLIAVLENEAGTSEMVTSGNTVGELGLVEGVPRMSSVQCLSKEAILYSLSRESYEQLIRLSPLSARLIDLICIGYLSNRVQHVSNRIFETRCLPI